MEISKDLLKSQWAFFKWNHSPKTHTASAYLISTKKCGLYGKIVPGHFGETYLKPEWFANHTCMYIVVETEKMG